MQSLHIYQARNHHRFFHTDMWRFGLSIWLHVIARSSISIFIPIFLLELGYTISTVITFYLLFAAIDVPLNFLAAKAILKFGAVRIYMIGTGAIIAFFAGFSQLELNQWYLLAVLTFLIAVYDSCYWVSHLYLFEKVSHKTKKISEDTGILYAITYFAALMGPAIGALVLLLSGSQSLIFLSIFIFILSIIPLTKMRVAHDKVKKEEKLVSPKEFLKKSFEKRNYLSVALFALHKASEAVIWPIFIYVTFKTIESVAFVPVIISATSIVFSYIAGKFARRNREKIIAISAFLISILWFLRLAVVSANIYYMSIFFVSFLALFLSIALYSNVFEGAKKVGMLNTSTYSNAISMFGQFIVYLVIFFTVSVFKVSFIFAALGLFALTLFNSLFILADAKKR